MGFSAFGCFLETRDYWLSFFIISFFSREQASDFLFIGHLKKTGESLAGQRLLKIHTLSKRTFELLLVIKTTGRL